MSKATETWKWSRAPGKQSEPWVLHLAWHVDEKHRDVQLELPVGAKVELGRGISEFGRALEHTAISDPHLALHARADVLVAHDLESKNGFEVNGRKIARGDLIASDVLSLPGMHLVVRRGNRRGAPRELGSVLCSWHIWLAGLRRRLQRWARAEEPVLFLGETGTGKLELARMVEEYRGSGPLVRVNVKALAEGTWHRELFGHARGSFTGADRDSDGFFQRASRGVLFLDEIGRLPMAAQEALLTVLDGDRTFTRVGDPRPFPLRALVIAASDKPLVETPDFEEALYHRIARHVVRIPPLRERPEDVLLLMHRAGFDLASLDHYCAGKLLNAQWSGNVRDVFNFVARVGDAAEPLAEFEDLPQRASDEEESGVDLKASQPLDPAAFAAALDRAGSKTALAKQWGVARSTIHRWERSFKER